MYLIDEKRIKNLLEWLSIESYILEGEKAYTLTIYAEIDETIYDIKIENLDLVYAYFVCYDYLMEQLDEERLFKRLSHDGKKE